MRPGNRQLEPEVGPPVAVLEKPAVLAVWVALAVPEKPVVPAVLVALAVLESRAVPAVLVALVVLEPALLRQLAAALVRQLAVAEKREETRSVAISRRGAAAVGRSLAGVGVLLKPRAAEVVVA